MTEPAGCGRLIREAVAAHGGVDGLVNNAGTSMWPRFEEVNDLSMFERIVTVSYLGAVSCTGHAAVRGFREVRALRASDTAGAAPMPADAPVMTNDWPAKDFRVGDVGGAPVRPPGVGS